MQDPRPPTRPQWKYEYCSQRQHAVSRAYSNSFECGKSYCRTDGQRVQMITNVTVHVHFETTPYWRPTYRAVLVLVRVGIYGNTVLVGIALPDTLYSYYCTLYLAAAYSTRLDLYYNSWFCIEMVILLA